MKSKCLTILLGFALVWAFAVPRANADEVITVTEEVANWAKQALQGEGALNVSASPNTVAVLYFANQTGKSDMDPLQKAFAFMLITDFSKVKGLNVVERTKLQALLDEMKLASSGLADPKTSPRVGKLLGAQWMVGGSFQSSREDMLGVNNNVLDVPTRKVTGQSRAEGALEEIFRLEKELLFGTLKMLKIVPTPQETAALRKPFTSSYKALMEFGKGLDMSDRGNYKAAAAHFKNAMKADPLLTPAAQATAEIGTIPPALQVTTPIPLKPIWITPPLLLTAMPIYRPSLALVQPVALKFVVPTLSLATLPTLSFVSTPTLVSPTKTLVALPTYSLAAPSTSLSGSFSGSSTLGSTGYLDALYTAPVDTLAPVSTDQLVLATSFGTAPPTSAKTLAPDSSPTLAPVGSDLVSLGSAAQAPAVSAPVGSSGISSNTGITAAPVKAPTLIPTVPFMSGTFTKPVMTSIVPMVSQTSNILPTSPNLVKSPALPAQTEMVRVEVAKIIQTPVPTPPTIPGTPIVPITPTVIKVVDPTVFINIIKINPTIPSNIIKFKVK